MYKDFPNKLKLAEITLFFQNEDFTSFCVKIFWENNTKTVISINRKLFLPFFRGCKKGFSFHCAVLWLVQKWKVSFYKKGYGGLVIIDLSKAFDPITHELVFSKLNKIKFKSQFEYCPPVWMFHGKQINSRINRLLERALKMINEGSTSSFDTLSEKEISFSLHDRKIQQLSLKM